ncbi:unnamed protein product [Ixodes hexagonus]
MDSALIQGIRRLLSDYDNMDELVQDLTAALEESSLPKRGVAAKWSAISGDDSESSLEGGRTGGPRAERSQAQLSDSDELLQRLCAWRHRQSNAAAAESDSVNENFLPRPQRRKRKLKRMAVDPPSVPQVCRRPLAKSETSLTLDLSRLKGRATPASPARLSSSSSLCGKRKRSVRERSLESLARVHRRSECCDSMDTGDGAAAKPHGESSSLSSSESDAGVLTNDEGREGDDEQSDFFHEAGPACGIPTGVVAWWDEEGPLAQLGAHFQAILGASLAPHMPHPHRDGREIRSGRRRLGKSVRDAAKALAVSLPSEHRLAGRLADASPRRRVLSERGSHGRGAEVKRRRRAPPAGGGRAPDACPDWGARPRHRPFLDPPPPPPPPSPQPS